MTMASPSENERRVTSAQRRNGMSVSNLQVLRQPDKCPANRAGHAAYHHQRAPAALSLVQGREDFLHIAAHLGHAILKRIKSRVVLAELAGCNWIVRHQTPAPVNAQPVAHTTCGACGSGLL